MSMPRSAN